MAAIAQEYSLFEIDQELDGLLDVIEEEIESTGEASNGLMERFQQFCEAHGKKVDRIGRFLRMMKARLVFCRNEATRLQERARVCDRKVTQTKSMVMYFLKGRELKKIEGREFTLRLQKNSQDCVRYTEETTNGRRLAERGNNAAIGPGELLYGVPEASIVNAASSIAVSGISRARVSHAFGPPSCFTLIEGRVTE